MYPRDGATVLQLSLQTDWKHGKRKHRGESSGKGDVKDAEYSHGTGVMFFDKYRWRLISVNKNFV